MAIGNPLIQRLTDLNENIRNRRNLGTVVNDQLFWLLNNNPNNNIIIDNNAYAQMWSINTNIDYQAQITAITADIANIDTQIGPVNAWPWPSLRWQLATQRARVAATEAGLIWGPNIWTTINSISSDIQRRITDINSQIATLQAQRTPLQTQLTEYTNIQSIYWAMLVLRRAEINMMQSIIHNIYRIDQPNFAPNLPAIPVINFWQNFNIVAWAVATNNIPLNNVFVPNGLTDGGNTYNINYDVCSDVTWEPLPRQNGWLQVTIPWGQAVTLRWVNINNNILQWQNITIDPVAGITFPINIKMAVRWRIQDTTWINLDHYKTFNLTINAPTLILGDRQWAYDNLNQNNPAGNPTINTRLAAEYSDRNRETLENEVIWEVLNANGNQAELATIYNNPQQRNLLIERIRNIPNLVPIFTIANLQAWFRAEMTNINRNVPVQYLVNQAAFADYLRLNQAENVRNFVRWQIRNWINQNAQPNRNNILRTLMDFQSDVINNRIDNNDHMRLDQNIPNNRPNWHPNSRFQRLFRRRSNRNNWTKFWEWKESDAIRDSIATEDWDVSYDIKVWVLWVNKFVTTINIAWEDEPIILDTRDPDEMVHAILRLEATKTWEPINRKVRCNMALNALKALISKSPAALHREYHWNVAAIDWHTYQVDRLDASIRWWNLVLRWSCAISHNNPPAQYRQRVNHVVFDEQRYKSLHNIDELERWMTALSFQINWIMNAMWDEFQEATSHLKVRPIMKYKTRFIRRLWRAKRIIGRIRNWKTNRNFDFETSASEWNKHVDIWFVKWKFILTWEFNGEPYEFRWRNLGKLLKKKMHRLRVFDGIDLAMTEKINENTTQRLRTNSFIGPENFWVADVNENKTWRIFIMDSNGDLSYLEIEDRWLNPIPNWDYGRIPFNNLPPQRIRCNAQERKEFMQNPNLGCKLVGAMRSRLRVF